MLFEENVQFEDESRSTSSVTLAVYWKYFSAGGGCFSFVIFLLSCVIVEFFFSGSDYWLSLWTDAEQLRANQRISMDSVGADHTSSKEFMPYYTNESSSVNDEWLQELNTYQGIYVFSVLTGCLIAFSLINSIHFFVMCTKSSINLHNNMFRSIIRAPLLFFHRNPVGKIVFK